MKKFEFRLDSVLRYRTSQSRLERAKMTQLLGEEANLKAGLAELREQRRNSVSALQNASTFEALELRSLSAYLVSAAAQETYLQREIAGRQQSICRQRACVMEADRQVKLLEKLKDKRYQEWHREFEKQTEQAAEEAWLCSHI